MNCITIISILVNGSRSNFFNPSRGIRQGDPLSPYIFILHMKMLFTQISHNVDIKTWTPFRMGKNNYSLFHLFYEDDLTLMFNIDKNSPTTILSCLNNFYSYQGRKLITPNQKLLFSKIAPQPLPSLYPNSLALKSAKVLENTWDSQ